MSKTITVSFQASVMVTFFAFIYGIMCPAITISSSSVLRRQAEMKIRALGTIFARNITYRARHDLGPTHPRRAKNREECSSGNEKSMVSAQLKPRDVVSEEVWNHVTKVFVISPDIEQEMSTNNSITSGSIRITRTYSRNKSY